MIKYCFTFFSKMIQLSQISARHHEIFFCHLFIIEPYQKCMSIHSNFWIIIILHLSQKWFNFLKYLARHHESFFLSFIYYFTLPETVYIANSIRHYEPQRILLLPLRKAIVFIWNKWKNLKRKLIYYCHSQISSLCCYVRRYFFQ